LAQPEQILVRPERILVWPVRFTFKHRRTERGVWEALKKLKRQVLAYSLNAVPAQGSFVPAAGALRAASPWGAQVPQKVR
jgi:hypothetical protein